jgi:CheY-like chemotaxis protein
MSSWAAELDMLSHSRDVLFIQAVGNLNRGHGPQGNPTIEDHLEANRRCPDYLLEASSRLANPAQSLEAITVGAVAIETFRDGNQASLAQATYPSGFTRSGYGLWNSIKPDVVEFGGDYVWDGGNPALLTTPLEVCLPLVRSTLDGGPAVARDVVGTSFAAPRVTHIAGLLESLLPEESSLLYRALIAHSARWPQWAELAPPEDKARLIRLLGYGLPDSERATTNSQYRVTCVTQGAQQIKAGEAANPTTPVVFVTQHSDFESRGKAAELGGHDLIGKPFLALEITVKALTLILHSRLQRHQQSIECTEKDGDKVQPKPSGSNESPTAPSEVRLGRNTIRGGSSRENGKLVAVSVDACGRREAPIPSACSSKSSAQERMLKQNSDAGDIVGDAKATPGDYAEALYRFGPANLEELRGRLQAASETNESTARYELLSEIYIGVHSLVSEARRAELSAFLRLGSAVEALLRKLLERSDFCAPSTFESVSAAFSLFEELCRSKVEPVVDEPPILILVVDDDPIALRGVAGAVQLVFGRPTTADSGEAALAAVAKSPFDLILLDVLMPGMDGFTTCSKIRQTPLNQHAPVVFVTSQSDAESRRQGAAAGGCGFIPKPFLAAELMVTVLTLVLRRRLGELVSSSQ